MAMKQYTEQTGREQALEARTGSYVNRSDDWTDSKTPALRIRVSTTTIVMLEREVADLKERLKMETATPSFPQRERSIKHHADAKHTATSKRRWLTPTPSRSWSTTSLLKTAQASAWKKKYYDFKETLVRAEDPRVVGDKPTMPVIPKDVAIAIFREGVEHGVSNACDEIDNSTDIHIEDSGYSGGFEVSFSKHIDLSEHLDLDWMRSKVGDYDEASVIEALKSLCAEKKFECRIHGIDDNPTNND